MANVSDSFRDNAVSNLQGLNERLTLLLEKRRDTEAFHRQSLIDALAPIEAEILDAQQTIYSVERMLGALPPAPEMFRAGSNDGAGNFQNGGAADIEQGQGETDPSGLTQVA